jgi:hypothetical protein
MACMIGMSVQEKLICDLFLTDMICDFFDGYEFKHNHQHSMDKNVCTKTVIHARIVQLQI